MDNYSPLIDIYSVFYISKSVFFYFYTFIPLLCENSFIPMAEKSGKKKKEEKKEAEGKSLKEALSDLSTRNRIVLALFTSLTVVTLIFLFLFALINALTPENVKEEDYAAVLSALTDRTWTIKKGDEKTLSLFLPGYKATKARSGRSDGTLTLTILSDSNERILHFGYRNDRIQGFIGSTLFSLFPSVGKDGKNYVLTLLSDETKIVFYEE